MSIRYTVYQILYFTETGSEHLSFLIHSLKDIFEHAILVFNQQPIWA